jgi:hypothetical protein
MNYTGAGVLRAAVTSLAGAILMQADKAADAAHETQSAATRTVAATRQALQAVTGMAARVVTSNTSQDVQRAAAEVSARTAEAQTAAAETLDSARDTTVQTETVRQVMSGALSHPSLNSADDQSKGKLSSPVTNPASESEAQLANTNETFGTITSDVIHDEAHAADDRIKLKVANGPK